jgi:DNA invertase Pin-like site-specific DNA recombinase
MGKAMFAICGTMAELERDLIAELREAGLAKARGEERKIRQAKRSRSDGDAEGRAERSIRSACQGAACRARRL